MKRIWFGIGIMFILLVGNYTNAWAEEYEYDALNRVTKVVYEDGSYVEYEYDSNGNLLNTNVYNASPEQDEEETDGGEEGGETKEEEETKPSEEGEDSSGSEEDSESTETPESGDNSDEDIPQKDTDGSEEKNVVEKIIEAVTGYVKQIVNWFKSWFR